VEDLGRRGATRPAGRRLFAQAYSWVTSYDRQNFFSFCNVCDTLNLCSEGVRERLLDGLWKATPSASSKPTARRRRKPSPVGDAETPNADAEALSADANEAIAETAANADPETTASADAPTTGVDAKPAPGAAHVAT
jgi:hypothetical protein